MAERPGESKVHPQDAAKAAAKQPWLWNVVLLDDADHTYDYVIRMMRDLFGHPQEKAYVLAEQVHRQGRAVCMRVHKELAELKRDQIQGYGRDPRIMECKGSMSSLIEPAEEAGEGR